MYAENRNLKSRFVDMIVLGSCFALALSGTCAILLRH